MNKTPDPSLLLRRITGMAAFAFLASVAVQAQTQTQPSTPAETSTPQATTESPVKLDPFTVNTTKDKGYAATNEISGSRVDTPIKDIPISIESSPRSSSPTSARPTCGAPSPTRRESW